MSGNAPLEFLRVEHYLDLGKVDLPLLPHHFHLTPMVVVQVVKVYLVVSLAYQPRVLLLMEGPRLLVIKAGVE